MPDDAAFNPDASAGAALPDPVARPWVESSLLDLHLQRTGADSETVAFCTALATYGLETLDLGDEARALCDQAVAETDPYFAQGHVGRVQDAWLRCKAVRRLATHPKVMAMLAAAYGRQPFAFQTLNFRRGTQQAVHSDTIHFHSEPERFMCGVWIALEDIAPGAGPLEYVEGSHRLPVLTMQGSGVNHPEPAPEDYTRHYLPALHGRLAASGLPHATVLPKKGHAVVWAANLAHGGAAITDPASTRRSLVTHVYFRDCLYYTPMTSDPVSDRFSVRLPADVATGGWVWPRRNGRRTAVPAPALVDALKRRVLRRPYVHHLSA